MAKCVISQQIQCEFRAKAVRGAIFSDFGMFLADFLYGVPPNPGFFGSHSRNTPKIALYPVSRHGRRQKSFTATLQTSTKETKHLAFCAAPACVQVAVPSYLCSSGLVHLTLCLACPE